MKRKALHIAQPILGTVALAAGGMLYVTYRPATLIYHLAGGGIIESGRELAPEMSDFVVYSLPGALWSMAYILIIDSVLRNHSISCRLAMSAVIPMVGAVSELLQSFGVLPGIFDMTDLFCYAIPYILYYMIVTLKK